MSEPLIPRSQSNNEANATSTKVGDLENRVTEMYDPADLG